jgi:hypothetical protein
MNETEFDFDGIIERRRAEKAEAVRFAKAGLGVHDSELVYADEVDKIITPNTSCPRDPFCQEWGLGLPEVV